MYNKQEGTQVPRGYRLCWVLVGRGSTEPWSGAGQREEKENSKEVP